jgi:hypothetical protein
MRRFLHRVTNLFRPAAEREMQREIAAHLALIEEDFEKQGLTPDEAKRAARRAYGSLEHSKELHREARTFAWFHELRRDILYGIRTLRQHRAFTLATLAVLTLGIGLTSAVFSIVDAILLKPLPVANADRLVALGVESPDIWIAASPAMYDFWQLQTDIFEKITSFSDGPRLENYTGGKLAEQWNVLHVNRNFFDTVGSRSSWAAPLQKTKTRPEALSPSSSPNPSGAAASILTRTSSAKPSRSMSASTPSSA